MNNEFIPLSDVKDYRLTDLGNAERFRYLYGGRVMFVDGIGWHVWDGKRWAPDEPAVRRLVQKSVREIWNEIANITDKNARDRLYGWANQSERSPRINAILRESAPHLIRKVSELDSDPWLFNVANGTIDLKTGILKPHDPADLITNISPVSYDPDADAPTWRAFLERIFPDVSVLDFMHRWLGSSLSAERREQCFVLCFGTGANGKTTIIEIVITVLGDYAATISFDALLHRENGGNATPELAKLLGKRFVTASEPNVGQRFNESLVKSITGGDTISARFLHKNPFEFKPRFKLTLAGNHRPAIRGTDHGIWRRVHAVEFGIQIPPNEQDPALLDKLAAEAPGILAWLVEGARHWLNNGLEPPEEVRAATEEYKSENDPIGQFLGECTVVEPKGSVRAKILFQTYQAWCEDNGVKEWSQKAFGTVLRERGFEKQKIGYVIWNGLKMVQNLDEMVHDNNVSQFKGIE